MLCCATLGSIEADSINLPCDSKLEPFDKVYTSLKLISPIMMTIGPNTQNTHDMYSNIHIQQRIWLQEVSIGSGSGRGVLHMALT